MVIGHSGLKPVITRFPADEIEKIVKSKIQVLLHEPKNCTVDVNDQSLRDILAARAEALAERWRGLEISKQHEFIRNIVRRVVTGQTSVSIEIDRDRLFGLLTGEDSDASAKFGAQESGIIKIVADFHVFRRGVELRLTSPDISSSVQEPLVPSIVKAIARARYWYERIVAGEIETIGQLTQKSGLTERYVKRSLQCSYLSPKIVEAVLAGKHRRNLTLKEILRGIPLNWREQERTLFGFPPRP
jgi:hypothetical protein